MLLLAVVGCCWLLVAAAVDDEKTLRIQRDAASFYTVDAGDASAKENDKESEARFLLLLLLPLLPLLLLLPVLVVSFSLEEKWNSVVVGNRAKPC